MLTKERMFETTLAGRKLSVQTGKFAQLCNGSCMIRYGDTVVHVAATASKAPREGIDFFPLSVDFEERLYSVGKIPGSFSKREGRPSDKAILASRVIDRPIRPLFPKDMRNDVSVVCTVMAVDEDCSPEITAMIGTSVALSISDIPWNGPICGSFVGLVGDEIVINPTEAQRKESKLSLTVASTEKVVAMIEAGADEVPEDKMYEAILKAHEVNKEIISFIKKITEEIGEEKFSYQSADPSAEMLENVRNYVKDEVEKAIYTNDKQERERNLAPIYTKVHEKFDEIYEGNEKKLDECVYKVQKEIVRNWIFDEHKRVDGRKLDEIRPLSAEVGVLPRVHGSGVFNRGQTQVMTILTLGPISDQQMLDGIDNEEFKRYMHHYNFPAYSVGEARPSRGPGRREIGHGALAERALLPVIPSAEEFPYALRLVSEVLSSNGSTSQASVCGSTLALMDGGVPIKAPVAGISCGLVTKGDEFVTMVDIQGLEDFYGDMDFKVAGTHKGITAIQMDLKIEGLTKEIIKEALEKTKKARDYILDEIILKAIPAPRKNVSEYAPKILSTKVEVDKIREVIGSGGKVVQKICADFNVKVDIEEDGKIYVSGTDVENCERAIATIKNIVTEPEIGAVYTGKVVKLMNFGAFIEFAPGKEGMCHISQISDKRVEHIEDALSVGQEVKVRITEIDPKGRFNLSMKNV